MAEFDCTVLIKQTCWTVHLLYYNIGVFNLSSTASNKVSSYSHVTCRYLDDVPLMAIREPLPFLH